MFEILSTIQNKFLWILKIFGHTNKCTVCVYKNSPYQSGPRFPDRAGPHPQIPNPNTNALSADAQHSRWGKSHPLYMLNRRYHRGSTSHQTDIGQQENNLWWHFTIETICSRCWFRGRSELDTKHSLDTHLLEMILCRKCIGVTVTMFVFLLFLTTITLCIMYIPDQKLQNIPPFSGLLIHFVSMYLMFVYFCVCDIGYNKKYSQIQ